MRRVGRVVLPSVLLMVLFGPTGSAYATSYTFDTVATLATTTVNDADGNPGVSVWFRAEFPEIDAFYVTDTLHVNVSFTNGESFTLMDTGAPFLGQNERMVIHAMIYEGFRAADRYNSGLFEGVTGDLLVNPLAGSDYRLVANLTNSAFTASGMSFDLSFSNPYFDPSLPIFDRLFGLSVALEADDARIVSGSTEVPEPASLLLLGTGLVGAVRFARRRR